MDRIKLQTAKVALDELELIFATAITKATTVGDRARMRRASNVVTEARLQIGGLGLVIDEAVTLSQME